jgi:transcriptional regulator with XRE-family HTH domain
MTQTRLKQLREDAVLTVHELAKTSGVSDDTISKIENGQRVARPSTLRKLASALGVSPQELRRPAKVEELALAGKAEAPRETGPTLLDKGLDAARHDEEKDLRAGARLYASEGTPQVTHSYEEDEFRAALRARGFPDEDFESFIWPLIVRTHQAEQRAERLEQENAQLQEERGQETAQHR